MSERVVDSLEVVEIEEVERQSLASAHAREAQLKPLVEQDAVRKVCQRVMVGHVRNHGFESLPLGNVFLQIDPAAVLQRLIGDEDGPAVLEMLSMRERLTAGQPRDRACCTRLDAPERRTSTDRAPCC